MTTHTELLAVPRPVERTYAIEDLAVRQDGTGRIVEAYAAAFNVRTEIVDQDGHYMEVLAPTSFTKTIQERGLNFGVLFNHALTVDGSPNPMATMPIGVPIEVQADERGVFTATRYLDNPLADQVLDAVRNRALKAQSFSGRFIKSVRSRPTAKGELATITRNEVDMREYGPAVFAAYADAVILGTRADNFVRALLATPPDKRLEWLSQFEGFATPAEPVTLTPGTPSGAASIDEPPADAEHSDRSIPLATRARAARIARRME